MSPESTAYAKHKNLKLAADELGIGWQILYLRLREEGVAVTGDKSRYGSPRDKLAARAEQLFAGLVPSAENMNDSKWQAPFDFLVSNYRVDVKVSNKNPSNARKPDSLRWAFLFTKQSYSSDFMCCFCLGDDGETVEKALLVPQEIFAGLQTLSVTCTGKSKWEDFGVPIDEIDSFFQSMPKRDAPEGITRAIDGTRKI